MKILAVVIFGAVIMDSLFSLFDQLCVVFKVNFCSSTNFISLVFKVEILLRINLQNLFSSHKMQCF